MGLFSRKPAVVDRVVLPTGYGFMVSGTTHRQAELRGVGSGPHVFRLVRVLDNPHDPFAVAVVCDGRQVGWIAARNSARYSEAIDRAGVELWVHGTVERDADGWLARIDCPFPEEIGV